MLPQLTVYAKILYLLMVVIFGALCREDHYVILSKCADDKTIHIAQDGKVSLTSDIAMTQNITIKDYMDWTAPTKAPNFTMFVGETQMYLCFNKHWRLVGMKERKDGCYFTDSMTLGYFEFHSASNRNKRIGFTYRGKPIGPKSNIHDENCYRFSKATPDEYFNRPLPALIENNNYNNYNNNNNNNNRNSGHHRNSNNSPSLNGGNINNSRNRNHNLSNNHQQNVNNDKYERRYRLRQHQHQQHQQQILAETAKLKHQQHENQHLSNEELSNGHQQHPVRHHHNDPRTIKRRQQHIHDQNIHEKSKHTNKQGNSSVTATNSNGRENTGIGISVRKKLRKNRNRNQNGDISASATNEKRTYLNPRDPTHRRLVQDQPPPPLLSPQSIELTTSDHGIASTEPLITNFNGGSSAGIGIGKFSASFLHDLQDEYSNDDASAINVLPNSLDSSTEYLFSNSGSNIRSKTHNNSPKIIQHNTNKKYLSNGSGSINFSPGSSINSNSNNNRKKLTNNLSSSVSSRIDVTNPQKFHNKISSNLLMNGSGGGGVVDAGNAGSNTNNMMDSQTTKKYYKKLQPAMLTVPLYHQSVLISDDSSNIHPLGGGIGTQRNPLLNINNSNSGSSSSSSSSSVSINVSNSKLTSPTNLGKMKNNHKTGLRKKSSHLQINNMQNN